MLRNYFSFKEPVTEQIWRWLHYFITFLGIISDFWYCEWLFIDMIMVILNAAKTHDVLCHYELLKSYICNSLITSNVHKDHILVTEVDKGEF